ncbi:MAG: hypothetical protein QOG98_2180, partial [Pseudonocardiales bacterium]|nr:hypothetical protein [Pseudonocardiales bacterium]
ERGRDRWRQRHGTTDQLTEGERKGEPAAGAEGGPTPSVAALFELARNGEPEADETRGPTASVGAAFQDEREASRQRTPNKGPAPSVAAAFKQSEGRADSGRDWRTNSLRRRRFQAKRSASRPRTRHEGQRPPSVPLFKQRDGRPRGARRLTRTIDGEQYGVPAWCVASHRPVPAPRLIKPQRRVTCLSHFVAHTGGVERIEGRRRERR